MKVLHVYSGGLDSTILLGHLLAEGHEVVCVNFAYGSKHNPRERVAAAQVVDFLSERFPVTLRKIDLDFNSMGFKSALLEGGEAIPSGHYADDNMKKTVVPFRNGIMISIAAGLAESLGMEAVSLGAHGGDHAIYPDCRPQFFRAIEAAVSLGTWANIRVIMPFVNWNKTTILTEGLRLGLPVELSYSCYEGRDLHCGVCGACNERKEAFHENKVPDTTKYEV